MAMRSLLIVVAAFATTAHGHELTWKNWEKKTEGKPVFLLFTSSGEDCSEKLCRDLEEAWAPIIEEMEDADHAVIGSVDCDFLGRQICIKMGLIGSLPNMRHGWGGKAALKVGGLTGYSGSRFTDKLRLFVQSSLAKDHIKKLKPGDDFVVQGPQSSMSKTPEELERLRKTADVSFTPEEFKKAFGGGKSKPADDATAEPKAKASTKRRRRRRQSKSKVTAEL
eukprot:TRINITY_DN74011_c0_g1_i1.p1 TRINITY_DN74011_c0_g1~~TRINITY_DN74011_c0_g1_i1.p1  ORF type:complete len:223 (-),score=55.38 TRINITY_DN74011_c0_g1_i1:185-853(-)